MVQTYIHGFYIQTITNCYLAQRWWLLWNSLLICWLNYFATLWWYKFLHVSHFNPLWNPPFSCLHVVKAIEAVGNDEVAATPCHSGYIALFPFRMLQTWSDLIGYNFTIFLRQTKCHFLQSKAHYFPHYLEPNPLPPICFCTWALNGWEILIGFPMLPLLLVEHICLRDPLQNQIFIF